MAWGPHRRQWVVVFRIQGTSGTIANKVNTPLIPKTVPTNN